ncbi:uncharacterized protein LOC131174696 [Hevea brasiliensis]|uniref:uncharacterized protein LOC131174696 n=1 Tax=Hevea brasiliensis TaxID=3981 RepID=UPI0025FD6F3B|nr:uncharacterized protein LOC131174696 [Hevea brasiliensis]
MGDVETRLAKVKLHLVNRDERFEEIENRLLELVEGMDETRDELQATLNEALDKVTNESEALRIAHTEEVSIMREENRLLKEKVQKMHGDMKDAKDELVLLKGLVAQGVGTNPHPILTIPTARVEIPKPSAFKGARNAWEIDNLLWGLEQYFCALRVDEDAHKVDHAPLYLAESAMVWWQRRMADMEKADEARAKLRRLTQNGTLREYVKEFSEVLLEIPDYPDQEALFSFKDGLQTWVKLEIERSGAQDLAAVIAIAESLVEFKKVDKAKNKDSKGKNGGDKGGGKENNQEEPKEGNGKKNWSGKRDSKDGKFKQFEKFHKPAERPPLKCFLCDGPHTARECPKNAAHTALVEEREEGNPRQEGSSMGSLQLAALTKGKQVENKVANKGKLFAQLKIGQNEVQALIDTGASDKFLRLKEAEWLGIAYHKQVGWLKAVNSQPTPMHGIANKVAVRIGEWTDSIDFSIISMDDYVCVLGMSFMDRVKAIPIAFANSLCIIEDGGAYTVPLKRGKARNSTLSALQLAKDVKRAEPTFLVALQTKESDHAVEVPNEVQNVLQECKDVMPKELPKQLLPKREVDHPIELLPSA